MHRFGLPLIAAGVLALLTACASETKEEMAAEKTELDTEVVATVNTFNASSPEARELADKAKGALVFPEIKKGGLIAGVESGEGALRVGGKTIDYYGTTSGSIGLQAGYETRSQIIFFMTQEALDGFRASSGWEAGVDGTITVIGKGTAGSIDTTGKPMVAVVFGQEGLMAGISLEGSKYSKLEM